MDVKQAIWDFCRKNGMTEEGTAGLMGNIVAESAFKSNNVEDRCVIADDDYTNAVDNETYENFVYDALGYGLCQWTYHTRKANLLAFAKNKGVSIADLNMQLEFMLKELKTDYADVYKCLCNTKSVRDASDAVMVKFENPYDQSEKAKSNRASNGFAIFAEFSGRELATDKLNKYEANLSTLCKGFCGGQVKALQALLNRHYAIYLDVDGIFGESTEKALKEYQQSRGLDADGICGADTWGKLLA